LVQKSLLAGVRPRREEAGKMPALLCLHQTEMRPNDSPIDLFAVIISRADLKISVNWGKPTGFPQSHLIPHGLRLFVLSKALKVSFSLRELWALSQQPW